MGVYDYFDENVAAKGINSPFDQLILNAGRSYDVDPMLIKGVISAESAWNPTAYRAEPQINDGSTGLMQILLGTARMFQPGITAEQLKDPGVNITIGTRYLRDKLTAHGYPAAVSAYNAGRPITGNERYVTTVDLYYNWFTLFDPLASGGTLADGIPFPRDAAREWRRFRVRHGHR